MMVTNVILGIDAKVRRSQNIITGRWKLYKDLIFDKRFVTNVAVVSKCNKGWITIVVNFTTHNTGVSVTLDVTDTS